MRSAILIFLALLSAAFTTAAVAQNETLPLKSVNKASEVIDAAIKAHGGAALDGLHSLVQEYEGVNYRTGQSRKPGPPYDTGPFTVLNAIDLDKRRYAVRNRNEGGGYEFNGGAIIDGDNGWQLNFRSGTVAPIEEPDYDTQSGPFIRITPPLLMKQLQARRGQSHWLGAVDIDGRRHDVITLVMAVGPGLALYIDSESHMLTRMERVLPPFGQVEYRFLDYAPVDGIPFNRSFRLLVNGEPNLEMDDIAHRVNAPLDEWLTVPATLNIVASVPTDELSVREIADDVYLAGGTGTYCLFVVAGDELIAVGGTQIVPAALQALREAGVDTPLKYGVVTHHHSDHVPGAATYAAKGATIIAPEAHEAVLRAAAGEGAEKFHFVGDSATLGSGDRRVELYDFGPTPHAEHILLAWVPHAGLVFEADHFPLPLNGTIPPAVDAVRAFAAALERLDLDYRLIAGTHSPRTGTPEDVTLAMTQTPLRP